MALLPTTVTKRKISIGTLRWLLIGEPKIGKTAILSGFPDLLMLATEKRYNAFNFHVVNVVSWKKDPQIKYGVDEHGVQNVAFTEIVDEICKGQHGFKTIAIDTIDILTTLCVQYVCKHFKIQHVSDLGFGKAYDMIKAELNNELNKLFMTNYGLIFTSHVKTREIIKPQGGTLTKMTSSLINQARDVVHPKVSAIGLMKAKTVKVAENKYEDRRVISFKPSELEEVGDGDGVMPAEIVTSSNPVETYELIKKYYEQSNK
jgi:hypothetical protein